MGKCLKIDILYCLLLLCCLEGNIQLHLQSFNRYLCLSFGIHLSGPSWFSLFSEAIRCLLISQRPIISRFTLTIWRSSWVTYNNNTSLTMFKLIWSLVSHYLNKLEWIEHFFRSKQEDLI